MRRVLSSRAGIAVLSALAGAGIVALVWALSGGSDQPPASGKVRLSFERGPNHEVAVLQRSGAFARAVHTLNYEMHLPQDLFVRVIGTNTAAHDGVTGPVYMPDSHTVYFPWLFAEQSLADLKNLPRFNRLSVADRDHLLTNAMTFVLYHELSHGVFNLLDVPVVGDEESAADNLASIFAIAAHRSGQIVPLSAAALSEARARRIGIPTITDYADEHGFDRQRAFNDLCLVYGSAPKQYRALAKSAQLPEARARFCRYEYQNDLRSWRRLLGRWLTRTGGLQPLPP